MKNIIYIFALSLSLLLIGCEEVVDVDLNTAPPRLVIDAAIDWEQGTSGSLQTIKLSKTAGFYDTTVPKVTGATVFVTNSSNTVFNFTENDVPGDYVCTDFVPQIDETYTLTVIVEGQTYTATETLKSVASITEIQQDNQGGFTGDLIDIKALFDDPGNQENYYLFKYKYSNQVTLDYQVTDDRFFQGNTIFSLSNNEDLEAGDQVEITHFGISRTYYNYMNVLISIAGNTNGAPFQSPPATVRGNIINTSNFDNYALGYFRASETDSATYTVQ